MKTMIAFSFLCALAWGQSTSTTGGVMTEDVTVGGIVGGGLPGVAIEVTCDQTFEGVMELETGDFGVWSTELIIGDTCTFHLPDWDGRWGAGVGDWVYADPLLGDSPVCPVQRVPGDFVYTVTGNGEADGGIYTWLRDPAAPESACDNCLDACQPGDYDGNGIVSVVSDLTPLVSLVFEGNDAGVCYWAADMDGDGDVALVDDVMVHFVNAVFFGIDYGTCEEAGE